MVHSRFRISLNGVPTRQIDGPTIGFQHLVTVTNTDSAVRRMLLSAMPETLLMSNLSQLSPSVVSDVTPEPGAADDKPPVLRPNVDSPTSELQSAMEVSNDANLSVHVLILTISRTCPLLPQTTALCLLSCTTIQAAVHPATVVRATTPRITRCRLPTLQR